MAVTGSIQIRIEVIMDYHVHHVGNAGHRPLAQFTDREEAIRFCQRRAESLQPTQFLILTGPAQFFASYVGTAR